MVSFLNLLNFRLTEPRCIVDDLDPRQVLARRLRALREEHWPGRKVNQAQLAAALSGAGKPVSVPLISSWESRTNPVVPPASRIQDICRFYSSPRSLDGKVGRLLSLDELTAPERAAWEGLLRELTLLRSEALDAPGRRQAEPDALYQPLGPRLHIVVPVFRP
jgi:hypothetical protein